jgi:phospholipid/cholesterol/gamma-HCH transport system permease protein
MQSRDPLYSHIVCSGMARRNLISAALAATGGAAERFLAGVGDFIAFAAQAIGYSPVELASPRGWGRLLPQFFAIGAMSVPVLMLTGTFIGMVLIEQGWGQFDAAGMADRLGAIVNISVVSELGPVLAGVMLAGRVGGALTAELGTMNVTEQLLALRSMGADPIRYLVTPRFLACLLLSPLLTVYADIMGVLGAWFVYAVIKGGDVEPYWRFTGEIVQLWDLGTGMVKAFVFGGVIGLISCYRGFTCRPGAEGVGQACTRAFVLSFIAILVLDFFLNVVINGLYFRWYGFRSLI